MAEREPPRRLDELDERIRAARERADGPRRAERGASGLGAGFRMAVDLVAGVGVGTGLGLLLDRWIGTGPWLMVAGFLLGAAAGFLNVFRAAERMERERRDGAPRD